jgi:GNAT superfamily N-acetyltransferase
MIAALLTQLGYPASAEAVVQRVERLVSSDADCLVVGDVDGDVVGFASVHISLSIEYDEPAAKLSALVVDEQHRRGGIGAMLVAELEARARRRDCNLIFLTTAERRRDAHAFYRRVGFEETGRRFVKSLR